MKRIFLAFLCLVSSFGFAQKITSFSSDSMKFIKELDTYFQANAANKDDATAFIENFEKFWHSYDFKANYKDYVYATCNKMLDKKLKPYPYFQNYLIAVGNFIRSKQNTNVLDEWQTLLTKIVDKNKSPKPFGDFLDMSCNVFENGMFYKSAGIQWYTDGNYKFDYDSLPKLVFTNITLMGGNTHDDSISVINTSGTYYPTSGKFYGKGGTVSWKRTRLSDDVYAEIKKYIIDCKSGGYVSDSAIFHNTQYFDKPQMGRLTDKIMSENGNVTYPRFDTYAKRLEIKSVIKDVLYDGGFSMRGAQFVGSGDLNNPARVVFKRNNQRFLEVSARNFTMSVDKITADNAQIKFVLDKDSIFHPSCNFKYLADQRKVSLIRTEEGIQKTPFSDTYHKLDMYFEELTWKIDSPKIDIGFLAANLQGQAFFESQDFFTASRFESIRDVGSSDVNPLTKINQYYEQNGKQLTFTAVDLAKFMKWLAVDLRPLLVKMASFGLITYNPQTDIITIQEKLFNYILANKKLKDSDVITFHSILPGQSNASINLLNNNFDLRIHGIKQVLLSDTQKVFVFPKGGEVVVKKNRDFTFDGVVAAGKFEYHGKLFLYDYGQNKINLKQVDSLRIYVTALEPEPDGTIPFKRVQTVIENISGELAIDNPKNHSGRIVVPKYPIFTSFKDSYAYYDRRTIQRGVYNRDKFYFKLDPFTIDSLDDFENAALKFQGEFTSAGVFPVFRDTLRLQKDYSLGFIRKTPPGGYQVYGGKGKFENEIRLSNKGLRGGGDISFSSSLSKGDDFIFLPDSMNGIANTFDIKETENPDEFPQSHGDKIYIHWMPYNDLMNAYDTDTPFSTYNKQAEFRGRYDLSPTELYGKGKVDFQRADLISQKILFKEKKFFSDTADFHLKAFDEEGFTFATDNVNATIDFEKRTGMFIANGSSSVVRFPKNQYISHMDRFKWFMDSETIQLGDEQKKIDASIDNDLQLDAPEFISVHPDQDSLRFYAPAAKYNLRKYIINCINVPYIDVADMRLFPDSGKVVIRKNAVIDTLKNAVIIASSVTKYHTIKNVTAYIMGRKKYWATGDYTYVDENEKQYNIHFAKIQPDTTGQTVSEGEIPEKDNFKFNDYFSYAGKVYLKASNQFLYYDGGTKILHTCHLGKSYFKFEGEVDPKNILIPISREQKDVNGNPVASGMIYSPDTNRVYSAFLSPRNTGKNDKDIFIAEGFLGFDKETKEYRISSKEKLEETSLPGNYLSLGTTNCLVYAEGKLELGADFGQVKVTTAGNATHNTINDSTQFDLLLNVDFFFDRGSMKKMGTDFEAYNNTLEQFDFGRKTFEKGMTEILGKERADKAISELNLYGNYKRFPDEFEKSIFLGDVQMNYNKKTKSFVSTGKIGVANIFKTEIYRYVDGFIQIKKQKAGDVLDMYFQLDATNWYYFNYYKGVMSVVSSNQAFNNAVKEVKEKKQKVDKGPSFQFNTCSPTKKDLFVKKIRQLTNQPDEDEDEK